MNPGEADCERNFFASSPASASSPATAVNAVTGPFTSKVASPEGVVTLNSSSSPRPSRSCCGRHSKSGS